MVTGCGTLCVSKTQKETPNGFMAWFVTQFRSLETVMSMFKIYIRDLNVTKALLLRMRTSNSSWGGSDTVGFGRTGLGEADMTLLWRYYTMFL